MKSIFGEIENLIGSYRGQGINHDGVAFEGAFTLTKKFGGRVFTITFLAKGKDGTVFHQEESSIALTDKDTIGLFNFNSNTPSLLVHELHRQSSTAEKPVSLAFRYGNFENTNGFREEIALEQYASGEVSYGYSWGLPGSEFKARSSVKMKKIAAIDMQERKGTYDLKEFDLHFFISSSREQVLQAWTTKKGMEKFLVASASFFDPAGNKRGESEGARSGDTYKWKWHGGLNLEGKVIGVDSDKIEFSFGEKGKLSLLLSQTKEWPCHLHLVQRDIPGEFEDLLHTHSNYRGSWIYYLSCLKGNIEIKK